MPYTPEEKKLILQGAGYDPEQFDLEDSGAIQPRVKSSPVATTGGANGNAAVMPIVSPAPKTTALGAFGHQFGKAVLPTMAGAGTTALTSLAFAPATGGLSLIPALASLTAGGIASYLTSKAQEPLAQKYIVSPEQEALEAQEHPLASLGGSVATLPLGGLNPALGLKAGPGILTAGRSAARSLGGQSINAMEKANLLNVGLGATLPVAQKLAVDTYQGREIDPVEYLKEAGIGALFSRPNAIGRKLYGFHEMPADQPLVRNVPEDLGYGRYGAEDEIILREYIARQEALRQENEQARKAAMLDPLKVINRVTSAGTVKQDAKGKEKFVPNKRAEDSALEILRGGETVPRSVAYEASQRELAQAEIDAARVRESEVGAEKLRRDREGKVSFDNRPADDNQGIPPSGLRLRHNTKTGESILEGIPATPEMLEVLSKHGLSKSIPLDQASKIADTGNTSEIISKVSPTTSAKTIDLREAGKKADVVISNEELLKQRLQENIVRPTEPQKINPQRDFTKNQQLANKEVLAESPEDLAMRKLEGHTGDKYQEKEQAPVTAKSLYEKGNKELNDKIKSIAPIIYPLDKPEVAFNKLYGRLRDLDISSISKAMDEAGLHPSDKDNILNEFGKLILSQKQLGELEGTYKKDFSKNQESEQNKEQTPATIGQSLPARFVQGLKALGQERGVEVNTTTGKLTNPQGLEINGRAYTESGLRKIEAAIGTGAKMDTLPHELGHHFFDDLKVSPRSSDRALYEKVKRVVMESPVVREMAEKVNSQVPEGGKKYDLSKWDSGEGYYGADEFRNKHLGEVTLKQIQEGNKSWLKQLKQDLKVHWTKNPSLEDISGHLGNRLLHDAPRSETHGTDVKSSVNVAPKMQDKEQVRKDKEATFIGEQSGFGYVPDVKLYNVHKDIVHPETGKLLHPQGSTVAEETLQKYGVKYSEKDQPDIIAKDKPATTPERIYTPALENVKRKGPEGKKVANGISEALDQSRARQAAFTDTYRKELKSLSGKEKSELRDILWREDDTKKSLPTSEIPPKLLPAYTKIREAFKAVAQEQIDAGQPVFDYNTGAFRKRGISDTYFSNTPSGEVVDILKQGDTSANPRYGELKAEFLEHAKARGYDENKANAAFQSMLNQWSANPSHKPTFGATRIGEGVGLPKSWIEQDLARGLDRYAARMSKDRAWHDVIEKDAELAQMLGYKQDAWGKDRKLVEGVKDISGDEDVQKLVQQVIAPGASNRHPVVEGLNRVVSSIIMGPLTTAGNTVSTIAGMSKHVRPGQQLSLVEGVVKKLGKAYENSFATGLNKEHIQSIEELYMPMSRTSDNLGKLANVINLVQGREHGERANRAIAQAYGETIVEMKKLEALAGDISAEKFLKKLANDRDWQKLSGEELGTRLAEKTEGTYDVRGLPMWVIDSGVAPYMKLSRWGIQQFNNFREDAWRPALKQGNYGPLLTTLFGTTVGGLILAELKKQVTGKEGNTHTFAEIEEAKDDKTKADLLFYKLASAASYAGFAGIASDLTRSLLDKFHGNKPQGLSYPTADLVFDGADKITDAIQAIKEGEPLADVTVEFWKNFAQGHIQTGRLLMDAYARSGMDEEAKGKFEATQNRNKLRKFEQVKGLPYQDRTALGESPNPFMGMKEKSFKAQSDPAKGSEELQNILADYLQKYGNEPELLEAKLKALKHNSYQTMPNIDRDLPKFAAYYDYLLKTQGKDKANAILADYIEQNSVNKLKASMVPSL